MSLPRPSRMRAPLARVLLCLLFVPLALVAQDAKRAFALPADEAEKTLKLFSEQSGRGVLIGTDNARAVRTNAVQGQWSISEALEQMLAGTGLVANEDKQSGAFVVTRAPEMAEKNDASRPASRGTAVSTGPLRLQTFEVHSSRVDGLNNKSIFAATEEAALPFNVIDRVEIERLGVTSMTELFRHVPENTTYGNVNQDPVGFVQASQLSYNTAGVNLRGFGSRKTVVLVNGRRLAQGTAFAGPDISRIPIGSIERVEILPASAAALYGGGAVGGVINIILRKEYNGSEATAYFGTSTGGGATEYRFTYVDGRTFNEGRTRMTTTVDFSKREPLYLGQRNYLERALAKYPANTPLRTASGQSAFEAYMLRAFAGMPGTIMASSLTSTLNIPGNPTARYAAVPAGLDLAGANALTPASFSATAGQANLAPRYGRSVLYAPQENYSVQFQLEHDIRPKGALAFYAEANAAYQRSEYSFPMGYGVSLSSTHPFNPFRTNVTPGFAGRSVTLFVDHPDLDDPRNFQERQDARVTMGLKGKVGEKWEWTLDASGQYARTYSDPSNPVTYMNFFLEFPFIPGGASLATRWATYNPFVDRNVNPISRQDHDELFMHSRQNLHYNWNSQLAFRAVGDVWELPAGPLRISPGAEVRAEQTRGFQAFYSSPRFGQMLGIPGGLYGQNTNIQSNTTQAAFVEATIPVIGPAWRPIPIERLEVGASRRWDMSNRTRSAVTNTLSGSLWLVKDFMLRASVTEGYVALDPENLFEPELFTNEPVFLRDPLRENVSTTVTVPEYLTGGNPQLRTEFARTRNFGFVFKPRFVSGLTVNVNYFETKQFDTPAYPSVATMLAFPGDYPGRIQRAPLTDADRAAGFTGGAITRIDDTPINITAIRQNGFDYRINYNAALPGELGRVSWAVTATHFNSHRQRTRPNGDDLNFVDIQNSFGNNPLRWRGNSQLFWERDRWLAGLSANYVNSYYSTTTQPTPANPTASGVDGTKIPHSLTFDVQLGYKFPAGTMGDSGWKSWLNATEFRLGILNVLDREPPFFSDSQAFYSRYSDPRQRFVYLQVKKSL